MTTRIFERAKVDEQGSIRGLEAHKGEEFLLVKAPKIADNPNLDKPREVVDEVLRYVREHRSLAERQYNEFTTRYGKPSDRFRELAQHLTPEEFTRRSREIADYAEKRVNEVRRDVEATYQKLEKELETRADAVLKRDRNGHAPAVVTLDEQNAAGSVENRKDREREF